MLKTTYSELETIISCIKGINRVEWYLDQDQQKGGVRITPAVFIKFSTPKVERIAIGVQQVNISFEVKLFTAFKMGISKVATAENKHLDLSTAIQQALYAYEQISMEPMEKADVFLKSSTTYIIKCLQDTPKAPLSTKKSATPDLKVTTTVE